MSVEALIEGLSRLKFDSFDLRYDAGNSDSEVGYVFDELMTLHHGNKDHPESPDRISAIHSHLRQSGLLSKTNNLSARSASADELKLVHSDALFSRILAFDVDSRLKGSSESVGEPSFVVEAPAREYLLIDADTYVCHASPAAARLAAGALLTLADAIMSPVSPVKKGFAAIRPPGHHATSKESMGFCLFNNAAVVSRYFQVKHGLKKVAIIDWDVHHGNGTSEIFYDDPSVLFLSVHRYDQGRFYPKTGHLKDIGKDAGLGFNVNVPIDGSYTDEDLGYVFDSIVFPLLDSFKPDAIVVSAGFDAARGDPLGECDVSPSFYGDLTKRLVSWTETHCEGRLLLLLEGGYDLRNIAEASEACISGLLDESLPTFVDSTGGFSARSAATTARSVPPGRPRGGVVGACHRVTKILCDSGVSIPIAPPKLPRSRAFTEEISDFVHSGGGHVGAVERSLKFPGFIQKACTLKEAFFYKFLQGESPDERGLRRSARLEISSDLSYKRFMERFSKPFPVSVASYMPECREINFESERAQVILADITAGFVRPCVLDMKMGFSYVNPDDSLLKKREKALKSASCSAAKLGVRLTACNACDYRLPKDLAKRMQFRHQIVSVLRRFLFYAGDQSEQLAVKFSQQIDQLKIIFERDAAGFLFVASSLLFCYDAENPEKFKILMIDFAHVHPLETIDRGYVLALVEIANLFRRASTGPAEVEAEDDL